ncbi:MAG: hypothetical protein N2450_05990 [bacterium]|nr:hypothetical protein [bacterium]
MFKIIRSGRATAMLTITISDTYDVGLFLNVFNTPVNRSRITLIGFYKDPKSILINQLELTDNS